MPQSLMPPSLMPQSLISGLKLTSTAERAENAERHYSAISVTKIFGVRVSGFKFRVPSSGLQAVRGGKRFSFAWVFHQNMTDRGEGFEVHGGQSGAA
jgi:hypothetical protein